MPWNTHHPYQYLIPIDDRNTSTIIQLPLAFVRSGVIYLFDGHFYYVGSSSCGWSRTSRSTDHAYYLDMAPANVNSLNSNSRWYGFPLRCLYNGNA